MRTLKIISTILATALVVWLMYLDYRITYILNKDSWEATMVEITVMSLFLEIFFVWIIWGMDIIKYNDNN